MTLTSGGDAGGHGERGLYLFYCDAGRRHGRDRRGTGQRRLFPDRPRGAVGRGGEDPGARRDRSAVAARGRQQRLGERRRRRSRATTKRRTSATLPGSTRRIRAIIRSVRLGLKPDHRRHRRGAAGADAGLRAGRLDRARQCALCRQRLRVGFRREQGADPGYAYRRGSSASDLPAVDAAGKLLFIGADIHFGKLSPLALKENIPDLPGSGSKGISDLRPGDGCVRVGG